MKETPTGSRKQHASAEVPYHVAHASFEEPGAERLYGLETACGKDYASSHLPDEATRDLARRMHYAAWRAARARDHEERARWQERYLFFRDRVVLGNSGRFLVGERIKNRPEGYSLVPLEVPYLNLGLLCRTAG